jgi:hypothetical protein
MRWDGRARKEGKRADDEVGELARLRPCLGGLRGWGKGNMKEGKNTFMACHTPPGINEGGQSTTRAKGSNSPRDDMTVTVTVKGKSRWGILGQALHSASK